jgi:hypothetical protein
MAGKRAGGTWWKKAMYDLSAIRKLATEFRAAIERCPRSQLPITFTDFPLGSCGDAALLLAKYLERNGYTGFSYALGMRDGGSHAWLTRDRFVVDITADQFEDQSRSVIVELESKWHESFSRKPEDQQPADFEKYDKFTVATLANAYWAVVRQVASGSA